MRWSMAERSEPSKDDPEENWVAADQIDTMEERGALHNKSLRELGERLELVLDKSLPIRLPRRSA
jgi:hypothetical protein